MQKFIVVGKKELNGYQNYLYPHTVCVSPKTHTRFGEYVILQTTGENAYSVTLRAREQAARFGSGNYYAKTFESRQDAKDHIEKEFVS